MKIINKFKNIHFLWLVGVICFLTFYVPVRYFTTYTAYIPEWTLPIFIFCTMMPLWFHEFLWRTSRIGSDSYNGFHDLHFEDKKWMEMIVKNPEKLIKIWMVSGAVCAARAREFHRTGWSAPPPFSLSSAIYDIALSKNRLIKCARVTLRAHSFIRHRQSRGPMAYSRVL